MVSTGSGVLMRKDDEDGELKLKDLTVAKDCTVRELIESKGLSFYRGCASYQLTNDSAASQGEDVILRRGMKLVLKEKVTII